MSIDSREIVTLENLRVVTRARSLAYGITLMLIGILEILWYGSTDSKLHTQFSSATTRRPCGPWSRPYGGSFS